MITRTRERTERFAFLLKLAELVLLAEAAAGLRARCQTFGVGSWTAACGSLAFCFRTASNLGNADRVRRRERMVAEVAALAASTVGAPVPYESS